MGSDRVPSDLCIGQKRPRNTKKCEEKSCLKYTWKFGNWSEVSKVTVWLYLSPPEKKDQKSSHLILSDLLANFAYTTDNFQIASKQWTLICLHSFSILA